jgi:adenylate cyclase
MLTKLFRFFHHPAQRGVWLGMACAVAVWGISHLSLFAALEDWMLDACFILRGSRASSAHVVIVALDDDSLRELGKPYAYMSPELAEVVLHLKKQGASAIGIDVMVPDDMKELPNISMPGGRGDAAPLGKALELADNVVLPQWHLKGEWLRPIPQWRTRDNDPFAGKGADLGFINFTEDSDHFVRRQQLLAQEDNEEAVQFALALHARARGLPIDSIKWDENGNPIVGEERIPLEEGRFLRINYVGPSGSFPVIPFHEVLADARARRPSREGAGGLRGAVVLIGMTARGGQDYQATPYANNSARWLPGRTSGLTGGTEIQGHIYATLHDRAFIRPFWWPVTLLSLMLVGAMLGWFFARLSLAGGFVLALGHHFAWKGVALAAFTYLSWRVPMVAMLVLGFVLYAVTFAWRWRQLRRMLGVVKSEAITLALEADPRRLDPGGEERELTVMFSDVRGFSTFSEAHKPHEVVALLNAYFTAIVPVIEQNGGTINQYMGDGIMVLFGAPASCDDHALRSVRAAVAMVRKVHELAEQWAKLGYPGMRIGVGINTGKAVVGAVGSARRLDYTAIGDTTNAAARIEAENKQQGTEILISAATRAALPDEEAKRLGCEEQGRSVKVKGKAEEVIIYAVVMAEAGCLGTALPDDGRPDVVSAAPSS